MERIASDASAEERVQLLEVRLEVLQRALVSLTKAIELLVKPRKEQTA